MVAMGHGNQRTFWNFRFNNVKILEKSRAARAKDDLLDHNIAVSLTDIKSEDPAKMTHSISDFLRRLKA